MEAARTAGSLRSIAAAELIRLAERNIFQKNENLILKFEYEY
jgi:hypothetical protein